MSPKGSQHGPQDSKNDPKMTPKASKMTPIGPQQEPRHRKPTNQQTKQTKQANEQADKQANEQNNRTGKHTNKQNTEKFHPRAVDFFARSPIRSRVWCRAGAGGMRLGVSAAPGFSQGCVPNCSPSSAWLSPSSCRPLPKLLPRFCQPRFDLITPPGVLPYRPRIPPAHRP